MVGFRDLHSEAHLFICEVYLKQKIRNFLIASSDLIVICICVWFFLSAATHGRFVWVSLLNMFAFQVFMAMILPALVGFFYHVRRLQFALLIALGLFLFTFGNLFFPGQGSTSPSQAVLSVMTYNMLVYTSDVSAIADVVNNADADIVFMQETSFAMADLLEQDMKNIYPYQTHFPSDTPAGLSVVSKYPFEVIDYDLGDSWTGDPILLDVSWNGHTVHVVNFHMDPTSFEVIARPDRAYEVAEMRRQHASRLVKFLQTHPGLAILAGDANDVSLNDPYKLLVNAGLQDAWTEAGFGLGHTFPGGKKLGNVYIPEWLVRIDYIFVTVDWDVLSAKLAGMSNESDHRAVVAALRLRK